MVCGRGVYSISLTLILTKPTFSGQNLLCVVFHSRLASWRLSDWWRRVSSLSSLADQHVSARIFLSLAWVGFCSRRYATVQ